MNGAIRCSRIGLAAGLAAFGSGFGGGRGSLGAGARRAVRVGRAVGIGAGPISRWDGGRAYA